MEWEPDNSNELILQQLNRAQNDSRLFLANASNGTTALIHEEQATAWIDAGDGRDPIGWNWVNKGKDFVWLSEKDGWRHLYKIDRDGKETLISKGDYDVIGLTLIDDAGGYIYFMASPDNATQEYLYRIKINGGKAERVTPADEPGTHSYEISPNGKIGLHTFSNIYTPYENEVVSLPDHKHISGMVMKLNQTAKIKPEFFKVKTVDGVEMDGWMVKPTNFDPAKKYPIVFFVYSEPAGATVKD